MSSTAIQDHYPEESSHCFGCGYSNPAGHQLRSYWNGGTAIAQFTPDERYTAVPGYVYGGLIASLIDCHGTATAAAALCQARNRPLDDGPLPRFVTAALKIDYLAPTPLGLKLELIGKAVEVKDRKVVVEITLVANGTRCASAEVIAVLVPTSMLQRGA
ncbi:MAG: PaaI family thioesterase [Halioglobus sp.]|nr:PaaI family thioesterase [Halioglobus sp.]